MEHLIIRPKENGYVQLTAEQGYKLQNIQTQMFYSEAVVKEEDIKMWKAVIE